MLESTSLKTRMNDINNTSQDTENIDTLFNKPIDKVPSFQFDQQVASVFPNMVKRSVPCYDSVIAMIGLLAQQHATEGTYCYDLGCSLGRTTLALHQALSHCHIQRIVGIDSSEAMIQKALTSNAPIAPNLSFIQDDITTHIYQPSSVIVLNLTLQFIPPNKRLDLLSRCKKALVTGGICIIFDKIKTSDSDLQAYFEQTHMHFKEFNQYSNLEIAQKRQAIEKVLLPDTPEEHLQRLKKAGFSQTFQWFQCLNWGGFLGISP